MLEILELVLLASATTIYATSWVLFVIGWRGASREKTNLAHLVLWAAFLFHVLLIALRTYRAGHLPFITAFEFVCAFSFLVIAVFLAFSARESNRTLGVFLLPVNLLLLGYAAMLNKTLEPEIMIFNGLMLKIHVATVLMSYACWVITFASSVCYLYLARKSTNQPYLWDQMAYKSAFIAFCFHTASILTGALWADQVGGVLWSWDMKETWSFITWLIFLCYLHARYNRAWDGKRAAYLAIGGFAALVFTYVGVDFLLPQLHSTGAD